MTTWVIVAAVAIIGLLLLKRAVDKTPDLTPEQIADMIEKYVQSADTLIYEWDDYTHIPSRIPALEEIRRECEAVSERFAHKTEWISHEGKVELAQLAKKARRLAQPGAAREPGPAFSDR